MTSWHYCRRWLPRSCWA